MLSSEVLSDVFLYRVLGNHTEDKENTRLIPPVLG